MKKQSACSSSKFLNYKQSIHRSALTRIYSKCIDFFLPSGINFVQTGPLSSRFMISIALNNKNLNLNKETSLAELLKSLEIALESPFAVTVNKNLIRRSLYEQTYLVDGDCVDILNPMQGG